jgi:imidazolonepropionase-like amidohydrolase
MVSIEMACFWITATDLFDLRRNQFLADPWIQICQGTITQISPHEPTDSLPMYDLGNVTLLPGLIDAHTHMTYHFDRNGIFGQSASTPQELFDGTLDNCRRTVESGFTTVRDLGSPANIILPVEEGIESGQFEGPQIIAALEPIMPYDLPKSGDRRSLVASMVQDRVDRGAQVIKVFLDEDSPGHLPLSQGEMNTLVGTAHQLGRKVAVHAHPASGAKMAIRAGADSIEHGTHLDDEAIAMMVSHGTFLVPTLYLPHHYLEHRNQFVFDNAAWQFFEEMQVSGLESAARAIAAGVKIALGTDSVAGLHGNNWKELEYLIRAGLTPIEALEAATIRGAELLGRPEIGEIAVGKKADLIGVFGDIQDPQTYSSVDVVIKTGQFIK